MITCSKREFRRYAGLNSRFSKLAEVLESRDLASLTAGRHDVIGDELFIIASPEAATRSSAMLEAHRKYIDVHVVLEGTETMGWAPVKSLSKEDAPFDDKSDLVCFQDECASLFKVEADQLAVFFPEDAHVPLLGDGSTVHKCVIKVQVD